jgi:hypothetical protein
VPVTAPARTLLDMAARLQPQGVESMLERAERLGLLDLSSIDSLLQRSGRHKGRRRLRQALGIYRNPAFTRSWLEKRFLALIQEAGLPVPATNVYVAGHEVDAYWEREAFAVELDGYETHGTRNAFERDPIRIEDLKLAGIDAIRLTARRVASEPEQVATRLEALLAQRRRERSTVP